jgi:hypothetical protein
VIHVRVGQNHRVDLARIDGEFLFVFLFLAASLMDAAVHENLLSAALHKVIGTRDFLNRA